MPRLKILLSYDGSDFGGWQRQDGGPATVQGELEKGLARLFETQINVTGSGRTDRGVHAHAQVAHADVPKLLAVRDMARAIGSVVPPGIGIQEVWEAPDDFHANRSALKKTYRYVIHNHPRPDPLRRRYTAWVYHPLNFEHLVASSQYLLGKQDFKSFQNSGTPTKTTVRHIYEAAWTRPDERTLVFTVTGNGFMKQMVRNMLGTMLDLCLEKEDPARMIEIIAATDRSAAGKTAHPEGLYLVCVEYPESLDNRCRKI